MKKAVCICLSMILLLLSCTAAVFAENAPVISVGAVQATAGEAIDVPVTVAGNDGLAGTILHIAYDTAALTLTGAERGTVFAGDYTFSNDLTASPFTVIWYDALAEVSHTETGTLCVLHFTVAPDAAAGVYALALSYEANSTFNADLDSVVCVTENGSVTVAAQETGGWSFSEDSNLHVWTNGEYSYITGLDPDEPYVSDYIETTGGWSFEVTENEMDCESTGALVTIYDENHDVAEQYETVFFGDVDGDGQCSIDDAMEIIAVASLKNFSDWALCDEAPEYARSMAADFNHDYMVDISDAMEIIAVVSLLQQPNQQWLSDDDPYAFYNS